MRKFLLAIFLSNLFLLSYAGKITGTIRDIDGKILPYASIFIKGTNKGTNANNEGKYSISLEPGQYILICQYVGYKREEKVITVTAEAQEVDFTLRIQEMVLGEVVLTMGNNPANEIIRKAIEQRSFYQDQLNKFQCQVYTKGQLRVRNYPKKILGQKV
ncbi:MAG: DUF5686 family protein, partial [Bacteroidota bacterium]